VWVKVVQSILFFLLGFLSAAFVALLVAPAIWRRAVSLTRRRIEGSAALSQSEIRAEKDQLRAGFALAARRLEMTIAALQEKAAAQAVEIGRADKLIAQAQADDARKAGAIAALEAEISERDQKLAQATHDLAEARKIIDQHAGETEKLAQMYDEASFLASNRQIDLVARESELEKLAGDALALRNGLRQAEDRIREATADARAAREALKAEQKRAGGTRADAPLPVAEIDEASARLDLVRERLEARLDQLAGGPDEKLHEKPNGGERESAELRGQMADLAAEVVHLAALREGPASPVARALAMDEARRMPGEGRRHAASLVERVRALQKATPAG
jgi:chromosome segregation ATPase